MKGPTQLDDAGTFSRLSTEPTFLNRVPNVRCLRACVPK